MVDSRTAIRRSEIVRNKVGYLIDSETIDAALSQNPNYTISDIYSYQDIDKTGSVTFYVSKGDAVGEITAFCLDSSDSQSRLTTQAEILIISNHANRLNKLDEEVDGIVGFGYTSDYIEEIRPLCWAPYLSKVPDNVLYDVNGRTLRTDHVNKKHQLRRLFSAFSENSIKYKFLELYRIIENQYLIDTYEELRDTFFQSPAKALDKAKNRVSSELAQIIALSERPELTEQFSAVYRGVSDVRGAYASQVKEKRAKSLKQFNQKERVPDHILGAATIYAVRCSVVHAGENDIIYDHFDDSDDFIGHFIDILAGACISTVFLED